MKPVLNHVALLVPSVERSAAFLAARGFKPGPAEAFEAEGTMEIYVGDLDQERGLLLLMEAKGEGPYRRAMEKRGPGLHHLAVDVPEMNPFLKSLKGSGWFLLPHTAPALATGGTAWLCRPGFPALIEVQARDDMRARSKALITAVEGADFAPSSALLEALGVPELLPSPDAFTWLRFGALRLNVQEICRG